MSKLYRLAMGSILFLLAACGEAEPVRVLSLATTAPASSAAAAPIATAPNTTVTTQAVADRPRPTLNPNRPAVKVAVGFSAPEFELPDLRGEIVRLSQFQGKAVLINFWATWCPPCKEELPLLQKTYLTNKDWLEIVGVDQAEEAVLVRLKVNEVGMTYPNLLDQNGQLGGQYRAAALPYSVFLDKDGVIRALRAGQLTAETLSPLLDKIKGK